MQRGQERPPAGGQGLHLTVMEGLGADGQAAQLDGLLESGGGLQALQLVVGVPGQLVGAQGLALFGQGEQRVPADDEVKDDRPQQARALALPTSGASPKLERSLCACQEGTGRSLRTALLVCGR